MPSRLYSGFPWLKVGSSVPNSLFVAVNHESIIKILTKKSITFFVFISTCSLNASFPSIISLYAILISNSNSIFEFLYIKHKLILKIPSFHFQNWNNWSFSSNFPNVCLAFLFLLWLSFQAYQLFRLIQLYLSVKMRFLSSKIATMNMENSHFHYKYCLVL